MDKALIKNWNDTVSNNDTVLHLGDFGLGNREYIREIIGKLHGKKILILGNHDNWSEQFYRDAGFHTVSRFPIIWKDFYILSHAPLPPISDRLPFIQYYGHVHNDERYQDTATSKCVSVERIGYRPLFLFETN